MRLLIIDDDKHITESLSDFLRSKNFVVDLAHDGETGLRLTTNMDYDLIITDYLLPNLDGQKLIKAIRSNGGLMPILAISTCGDTTSKINLFDYGVDDYIVKPFFNTELHARVNVLLRRPRERVDKCLSFFNLKLNLLSHEAYRDSHLIYLTAKEFLILELLMENPERTFSRHEIIEKAWDYEGNPLSNIIESHILHLRRKINFKKPYFIQTVPGRGYRLS